MNTPLPDDDPRSPANIARRRELKLAERDELGRLLSGSGLERAGSPEGSTVTTLARLHTHAAVTVLREIVDNAKAPPAARANYTAVTLPPGTRGSGSLVSCVAPLAQNLNFENFQKPQSSIKALAAVSRRMTQRAYGAPLDIGTGALRPRLTQSLLQHQFHRAVLLVRRVLVFAKDALDHQAQLGAHTLAL